MTGGGISGLHGAINLLPDWLAVIWVLVFLGVFLVHIRHLVQTRGPRQLWHAGHILMAIGMAFMFIPASIVDLNIPASFWQLTFAGAALVIVAWMLTEAVDRHPINALWIVAVTDLAAMVYMWSPTGFQAPLTWLLVAYFLVQTLLWATDRMRSIDHHTLRGGYTVTSDGAVGTAVASPLICYRDLRLSMASMTTGMAYMLVAMQLLV